MFGARDEFSLVIKSHSNNADSFCLSNGPSFELPGGNVKHCDWKSSSINGSMVTFKSKELEVFKVFVRITLI